MAKIDYRYIESVFNAETIENQSQSSVKWNEKRIQKKRDVLKGVIPKRKKISRSCKENEDFRREVIARAGGECIICGRSERLEVHHLDSYKFNPFSRYDPNNGVALCHDCHHVFHKQYGVNDTTREQFNVFYSIYKV